MYPCLFQKDVVACIVEVDVCLPDGGGVPTQGSPAGAGLLLQPSLRGEPSTWLSSGRGEGERVVNLLDIISRNFLSRKLKTLKICVE